MPPPLPNQIQAPVIPIVSAGAPVEPGLPCPTLHVSNLNERIHPKYMKEELQKIFSVYGHILNISCKRKLNLRGQAFVVFQEQLEATKALQSLQTRTLYGKSMVIRYARRMSNATIKRQGGRQLLEQERLARQADKMERAKYPRLTKRQRLAQAMASGVSATMPIMVPQVATGALLELPNKTVFVQGLPADAGEAELINIFKRYIGFVELRRIPNQPEIAFVEYETEAQAAVVRNGLDRHELRPGHPIRVTFAKR